VGKKNMEGLGVYEDKRHGKEFKSKEEDSSPQAESSKRSCVKPEWVSPPRGWWSEELAGNNFDESFEAMWKEDSEAREQIEISAGSEKRSERTNERSIPEDKEVPKVLPEHGQNSQESQTPSTVNRNITIPKISEVFKESQSNLGFDSSPDPGFEVADKRTNISADNSLVTKSKAKASTGKIVKEKELGSANVMLPQVKREKSVTPINTIESHSKSTSKKPATRVYSNFQTRAASKKLAETPPPQNEAPDGSRTLRSSGKGKSKNI
jgi:hypothetical protein